VVPFALEGLDRIAAAFSIESRYPFFDKRLVEFCLALPPEQKLNQGWTRVILRRAMTNILPTKVQWRENKANLSPNFNRSLLAFERELLEEVILNDPQAIEEYVNVPALREAYHRYTSWGNDNDAITVWRAITLALWLRRTGFAR
jgi:asparagine synthase (glutamine-hydrolysing)